MRPIGTSKSLTVRRYEVPASPAAAKAAATSSAAGTMRMPRGERTSPAKSMITYIATAYSAARIRAQSISPIAISVMPIGVASTPS